MVLGYHRFEPFRYSCGLLTDNFTRIGSRVHIGNYAPPSSNWSENYNDPEEQVRAEFWAELIYRYGYPPNRIGIEVVVPDRTPFDRADLVIFEDDERKRPFAVIECKRDGITDAEFEQAVEQASGIAIDEVDRC